MLSQNNYEKFVQAHGLESCENRLSVDRFGGDDVFCKRANAWVNCQACRQCGPKVRKEVSGEW